MMAREPVDSVFEPLPAPVDPRDYEHQRGWDEPPSDDERLAQRPIPAEEPRTVPRRAAPSDEGPRYPSANTRQTHSRIFSEAGSLGINERLTVGKPSTAFSSHHPVDSEDPSLARFYREHVSPPRQVRNYIAFICDREKIHPSRVELFINMISEETGTEELVQLNKNMTLRVGPRECGSSEKNPLLVTVEMDEGADGKMRREDAIHPLPLWVEGGRAVGTGAAVAGHGFLVGLIGFGKFLGSLFSKCF